MNNEIGIVTYCGNYNYGSILQSLAMKRILGQRGFEAVFLLHDSKTWRWRISLLKIAFFHPYIFIRSFNIGKRKRKNDKLEVFKMKCKEFINNELHPVKMSWKQLKKYAHNETTYCCICGSDQIWNLIGLYIDPFYFLQFAPINKRVSYAPSFGEVQIQPFLKKKLGNYISAISNVSVREESGAIIIAEIANMNVPVVIDPVFLLTEDEWEMLIQGTVSEPYRDAIILYFLDTPSDVAISLILEYKNKNDCMIYIFKNYYEELNGIVDDVIMADPLEFVSIISYAKCVFTDSFHGTAFSIMMHTSFYVFARQYQKNLVRGNERIQTLLSKFALENRLIQCKGKDTFLFENIDFDKVDVLLEQERRQSLIYLDCSLNGIVQV